MAYQILKQEELFDSSNRKISILKYAIIQDDNKNNYLLLKLQNTSKDIINGFTLNFYDNDQETEFVAEDLNIEPNMIFFEKQLIPVDSTDISDIEISEVISSRVQRKRDIPNEKQKVILDRPNFTIGLVCSILNIILLSLACISIVSIYEYWDLYYFTDFPNNVEGVCYYPLIALTIINIVILILYLIKKNSKIHKTVLSISNFTSSVLLLIHLVNAIALILDDDYDYAIISILILSFVMIFVSFIITHNSKNEKLAKNTLIVLCFSSFHFITGLIVVENDFIYELPYYVDNLFSIPSFVYYILYSFHVVMFICEMIIYFKLLNKKGKFSIFIRVLIYVLNIILLIANILYMI